MIKDTSAANTQYIDEIVDTLRLQKTAMSIQKGETVTWKDVADELGISQPGISRAINRRVQANLAQRLFDLGLIQSPPYAIEKNEESRVWIRTDDVYKATAVFQATYPDYNIIVTKRVDSPALSRKTWD